MDRPIPTKLRAVLAGEATADIKQQALQEGGGVADNICLHDISATTTAMRQPPRAVGGGLLVPTPLGPGAGAWFQNSRCAVHS